MKIFYGEIWDTPLELHMIRNIDNDNDSNNILFDYSNIDSLTKYNRVSYELLNYGLSYESLYSVILNKYEKTNKNIIELIIFDDESENLTNPYSPIFRNKYNKKAVIIFNGMSVFIICQVIQK